MYKQECLSNNKAFIIPPEKNAFGFAFYGIYCAQTEKFDNVCRGPCACFYGQTVRVALLLNEAWQVDGR